MTTQSATQPLSSQAQSGKEFFNYYLDPQPEHAPGALMHCIEKGMFGDPENVVWFLFARIARDNPWLVRRYESLFRKTPAGRPVLLKILRQSGDLETRRFLLDLTGEPQFAPLQAEIEQAIHDWPGDRIDPLTSPVRCPADLDLLWCEFRATGSIEPVLRVIDVFERPDRVREKLNDWLRETPLQGPAGLLWNRLRKRTARKLREEAAILCDLDGLEVLNPEDLDCHCVMQDMVLDATRARKIARLLPFGLEADDTYLYFKGAARWSLASHAREHRVVYELCKSEAALRGGRCRTLLQEIVDALSDPEFE